MGKYLFQFHAWLFCCLKGQTGISPIKCPGVVPGWPGGASGVKGREAVPRGLPTQTQVSPRELPVLLWYSWEPAWCFQVWERAERHKPLHAHLLPCPKHTLPSKKGKLPTEPPGHRWAVGALVWSISILPPYPSSLLQAEPPPSSRDILDMALSRQPCTVLVDFPSGSLR